MKRNTLLHLFLATHFRSFGAEALSASDFSFFGDGRCSDSSGSQYGVIKNAGTVEPVNSWLVPLPITTTDEYCLDWCSQNNHPDLVGVSIYRDWKVDCRCLFSGGRPSELGLDDYNPPGYYEPEYSPVGEGAVQTTSSFSTTMQHEACYLNNVRTLYISAWISHSVPFSHSIVNYYSLLAELWGSQSKLKPV